MIKQSVRDIISKVNGSGVSFLSMSREQSDGLMDEPEWDWVQAGKMYGIVCEKK